MTTDAATTIQKIWRGKSSRQDFVFHLINELLIEIKPEEMYNTLSHGTIQWKFIDVFCPRTASIVEYCAKHGAEANLGGMRLGTDFMTTINHDLWLTENNGGPGSVFYNRVSKAVMLLHERLNPDIWC